MKKYIPIKVKKRIQKQLIRDASGSIFHRVDKEKNEYFVKAADKYGQEEIERYGLITF